MARSARGSLERKDDIRGVKEARENEGKSSTRSCARISQIEPRDGLESNHWIHLEAVMLLEPSR